MLGLKIFQDCHPTLLSMDGMSMAQKAGHTFLCRIWEGMEGHAAVGEKAWSGKVGVGSPSGSA